MDNSVIGDNTRATLKNAIFVAIIVLANTVGNLLLAMGMDRMPDFWASPFPVYVGSFLSNLYILAGTVMLIISMVSQLSMYTWADLSYVLPVTASAYLVTALLSRFFLHEHVSLARWAGVVLISLGVMEVSATPAETKHREGVTE